jgi:hypothetical protein
VARGCWNQIPVRNGIKGVTDLVDRDAPWDVPIPAETIERAIRVARYLIPHAIAAFAEMGADEVMEKAKSIARWIAHEKLESFSKRDVHQSARSTFRRASDVEAPLAVLVERSFIRKREENATSGAGRPASPIYDVNPKWLRNTRQPALGGHSEYCEDSEKASREIDLVERFLPQVSEIVGLE